MPDYAKQSFPQMAHRDLGLLRLLYCAFATRSFLIWRVLWVIVIVIIPIIGPLTFLIASPNRGSDNTK
jgi:hypothetical protein